jgi:23S rRNA pseudouridine955/2504/2580 synthase
MNPCANSTRWKGTRCSPMPIFTVDQNGAGQRLDRFLRKLLKGMPQSHIFKLVRTRKIRVNGKRARGHQVLVAGDILHIHMPEAQFKKDTMRPVGQVTGLDFQVKFEDEHMLVVSKPPFLPVHPGAGHRTNSLIDQIHAYLEVGTEPAVFRPSLVHRLDRDTSGLIVIGKTLEVVRDMSKMFKSGQIDKSYLALAKGTPNPPRGTWSLDVKRRDLPGSRSTKTVSRGRKDAPGRTAYHVAATRKIHRPDGRDIKMSLLVLQLLTGRTHQIRSHLYQVGHPLAGDVRYGDKDMNRLLKERYDLRRQFLHAFRLRLKHPVTGKQKHWTDSYPPDLMKLVRSLRLGMPAD